MNLAVAFTDSAKKHGDKTAIYWGPDEFSYGNLLLDTKRLASHLHRSCAVQPGQRIGLWLRNCPQFVPSLFGILEAGAIVVPINNFLKPAEVDYILNDAGIDLLITDASMREHTAVLKSTRPSLRVWEVEEFPTLPDAVPNPFAPAAPEDLAVLIYTSGTTGHPKGAMLTHANLWANIDSCREVLAVIDADRFVVLLPMFHSFMLTVGILLPLMVGGSLVVIRSVHPPKNIFAEILQRDATILPAIPQFFRSLANAQLPSRLPLRLCISGGAPLPGEILREFNAKLPIPLIEGYGLSEASPVVSVNPILGPWKAGSIGVPIPRVEVSIQNDSGQILGAGETGEVCVRGANVMKGYWNQPEATAGAFRDGWLLTGDVGHRDSDGYFYITDRKKDMLLVNGINVYPRQIEEVIYTFPGVKEAAVIGVPDARRGEQPMAFVMMQDEVNGAENAILKHLRERLADFKVPRRVVFLKDFPRNATGKVLKNALRTMASLATT